MNLGGDIKFIVCPADPCLEYILTLERRPKGFLTRCVECFGSDGWKVTTVKLSGGAAIARALKSCGIDHVFYVTGGMGASFYRELERTENVILCRNEKAACCMAEGFSRLTQRPSACYSQHGAAAAILASMLYEPMSSHSPVIALTGTVPSSRKDRWYYQECDEMPYFQSTCKFNADVTDLSRLAEYIRIAIQVAVSGCPGPTHISIQTDMSEKVGEMPDIYENTTFFKVPPFRPRPEKERIMEAAKLLVSADCPVMVCGSGVHISGAYDEVREIAELLTIPVVTNYRGKGCFLEQHPLWAGVMGTYGMEYANEIVRGSDLVFFVGTRAEPHMTEELTAPEPGASRIIHLDIDPLAIGRNYRADVPLVGDAKLALQDLIVDVKALSTIRPSREQRVRDVASAKKAFERIVTPMMESNAVPIKPQRIMNEISKILRANDLVVSDTGFMMCWSSRLVELKGTGVRYIPCGGTLGSSLPLAIGVSFAASMDQRVFNLIGDGGIGYNIADLETAQRYNDRHAPLVVVVNNNSSLAQSRPRLEDWSRLDAPWIDHCDFGPVDYAKVAEGFGCYGIRVERPEELQPALQNAVNCGRPALVDVVTDKREYVPFGPVRRTGKEQFPGVPIF